MNVLRGHGEKINYRVRGLKSYLNHYFVLVTITEVKVQKIDLRRQERKFFFRFVVGLMNEKNNNIKKSNEPASKDLTR